MKKPSQKKVLVKIAEIVAASTAGTSDRRTRGRKRNDASFPVGPLRSEMPVGYAVALAEIKRRIQEERLRTVMAANSAMVMLYWDIGRLILNRQEKEGWGAKVIDRLSADLREAYPDMDGLSSRNLLFMRSFAAAYPDMQIVKQLVSQLPWGHVIKLLQRINDPTIRDWYVTASIAHGWSRNILEIQIDKEDERLSWEEKTEKTRKLLENDPLWRRLRKRLVEPKSVPVAATKGHKQKVTEKYPH